MSSISTRSPSGTRNLYVCGVPLASSASTSSLDAVAHLPVYLGGSFFASCSSFIIVSSLSVQKHGYACPSATSWSASCL